jgi:hypothetical protein
VASEELDVNVRGAGVGDGFGVGGAVGGATNGVGVATMPTSAACRGAREARPGKVTATAVAMAPLTRAAVTTTARRFRKNSGTPQG